LSTATGILTERDMTEYRRALSCDPDFVPNYKQIFDLRGVTDSELTSTDLRERAANNVSGGGSRRALVASSDLVFGMARMYQLLAADENTDEIRVFRDMSDAVRWVDLAEIDPAVRSVPEGP
jgi:hypothetical protein